MDYQSNSDHTNLYLSVSSAIASILSFVTETFTKTNIAWALGCGAAIVSIWAGILTAKEKRMSMRKMESEK